MSGLFLILFIAIPILDIYSLTIVGEKIGFFYTLGLVILIAIIGVNLIRSEGAHVLRKMGHTISQNQIPGREILEGLMVFIGGGLLIFPGFVSDIIGILLLFPLTRWLFIALAGVYFRHKSKKSQWKVNTYTSNDSTNKYHTTIYNSNIYEPDNSTRSYKIIDIPRSEDSTEEPGNSDSSERSNS